MLRNVIFGRQEIGRWGIKDKSYWNKRTNGTNGTTRGMNLLDKAAEKDPMSFCKMVASIIPKELHKENTVQVNFVEALKQINSADIVDVTPIEDNDEHGV